MTDPPMNDHARVHEALAAYVAGGLDAAERRRVEDHLHDCPACFEAYVEARDADRAVQRAVGLVPEPSAAPGPAPPRRMRWGQPPECGGAWRPRVVQPF